MPKRCRLARLIHGATVRRRAGGATHVHILLVSHVAHQPSLVRDLTDACPVDRVLLVRETERRRKRDDSPYLRLVLADRSGSRPRRPVGRRRRADARAGRPVHVTGRCAEHPRYGRQLTIETLSRPRAARRALGGPARRAGAADQPSCARTSTRLIASVQNPHLSRLIAALLDAATPTGRAYREAPAAKYNHHAYRGGLLEHSVQIAQLVDAAAALFDGIDRDLAVCGALLHDIGKLEAYAGEHGCADLTDAGKLEGEIPLGYYRVRREIEATPRLPARARPRAAARHPRPPRLPRARQPRRPRHPRGRARARDRQPQRPARRLRPARQADRRPASAGRATTARSAPARSSAGAY